MHSPGTTDVLEAPAGVAAPAAPPAAITGTGLAATQAGAPPLPEPAARPAGTEHVFRPAEPGPAAASAAASPVAISGLPGGQYLPCTDDPELFFAGPPQDVECAKALCRGCPARIVRA